MDDQRTCGQGLAESAVLPAKLGVLTAAMADVLETHIKALDPTDGGSRKERDAYRELSKTQRSVAAQLQAIALKMAACRSLPMGKHDPKAMLGREALSSFKTFVAIEQEVATLLQERLEQDRQLLAMMNQARSPV